MSDNKKIQTFKLAVEAGPYDVDENMINFFIECIKKAELDKPEIITNTVISNATTVSAPKTKKLTGYNIFMKEKMAEFKAQNIPVGDRMGKVSEAWKALTQEEKLAWKAKADLLEPVTIVSKGMPAKKGPKSMTGYQFYVKETMPTVKVNEKIAAKDRLAEIGKMWKSLSEEQHAAYKVKAGTVIKTQ